MANFDIEKIIVRFKIKYPHFETIIDRLPIVLDDTIETACTDGEKLYFNKQFMESLDEEEQLFTLAHEVLHVALNHIDRCLGKNMYYWNLATDAVINDYLRNSGLKFIEGCVDVEGALNQTAEELYEKFLKEEEEKPKDDKPKDIKDSDKNGNGKPTDSPSSGNGDNDKNNDKDGGEKSPSDGNGDDDKPKNDNPENGNETGKDEKPNDDKPENKKGDNVGHDDHSRWQEAAKKHQEEGTLNKENTNENEEFKKNDEEKRKKDDDYLKHGLDGTSGGNAPGTGRGIIDGIEEIDESPICWQELLKMNYRSNPDWINTEEVEYGVVIEDIEDEESCECEIVIDTSASISEDLVRNFLTECLTIAKRNKIKVGFFDTRFYGFHDIRNEEDINELKIEGGGGTDFNPAIEAFTDSCPNKIIFTDGYATMPEKEVNANWIVFGDFKYEIHPKGGNVIYINGEEYESLKRKRKTK